LLSGLVLIAVAAGLAFVHVRNAAGQSNTDFALCGAAIQSTECQAQLRPVSVAWERSSANGFQKLYEVDIQTGKHTTIFFTDLTERDVAPLQGLASIEVRYRNDRPVAVIWPDGTSLQIPIAPTHSFWMTLAAAAGLGLAGAVLVLMGIVRAARARLDRVGYAY
jgi:hypothetical protein